MRPRRNIKWLLVPAICVLLGFLFALRQYLMMVQKREPISWSQALFDQLPYWLLWAIISPLILRLDSRFPVRRRRWAHGLFIHLPASALAALAQPALYFLLTGGPPSRAGDNPHLFTKEIAQSILVSSLIPGMVFYWMILVIDLTFEYHRRYQEETSKAAQLNTQLAEARLHALKMQLHPHFLFNTLHSVAALVLKKDSNGAVRMINRLSSLLRFTLESAETQEVSLSQELELLELYLEIERIRFQDRLTVAMHIEPQTLAARVPNLILQPLVENAVRHSLASDSSPSRIEIHASREDGKLHLEVRDDGPGWPENFSDVLSHEVGLRNTRSRLSELYGHAHDLSLRNYEGRGAVATLTIPFHTARTGVPVR